MVLASLWCVTGEPGGAPASSPHSPVNQTGALAGTVRFPGEAPEPAFLRVHKEQAFCGLSVPDESLQVAPGGGLQNVVVTLHGPGLHRRPGPPETIALDNVGCRFAPHVQAVRAGSTVLLLNSDPILHDAHARLGPRTLFNDGLPWWRRVKRTLHEPGVVKVICELHRAWMSAYIVVAPNPFFAVTGAQGRYAIHGVPPGTYRARFWHERLGVAWRQVVVDGGETRRLDLVMDGR